MDWGVILGIVGIVIGLVALAVAIPPLFQMLYGRPRLEFLTDEFTGPDGKSLLIAIKNQPTRSRFLRKIGVEREIGNVLAYLDIQQQGTGQYGALCCERFFRADALLAYPRRRAFTGACASEFHHRCRSYFYNRSK
jgi:hypothetical protein